MKSPIAVNPTGCIGCHTYEVVCVIAHPPEQELNVDVFLPRSKVQRLNSISISMICHQRENAPYIDACSMEVLTMGEQMMQANFARCIGYRSCISTCSPGMISIQPLPGDTRRQIVKCDLCKQWEGGPACVESYLAQALQLLTGRELRRVRQQRIVVSGENPLRKGSPR